MELKEKQENKREGRKKLFSQKEEKNQIIARATLGKISEQNPAQKFKFKGFRILKSYR